MDSNQGHLALEATTQLTIHAETSIYVKWYFYRLIHKIVPQKLSSIQWWPLKGLKQRST